MFSDLRVLALKRALAIVLGMAMILPLTVVAKGGSEFDGAWYGTNYTVPFAHAYRELGRRGVDRKQAIDRDVYHISRLGLNAFRLHLWDVELSDSAGKLLDNEHLDLLDYLIAKLEERGIDIVLTAQTKFGNGYPERNINTGAYSYNVDKCEVHSDPVAVAAQQRYLTELARHVNPYNGRSYEDDTAIVAMEINNEPCHGDDNVREVETYIRKMISTLKKAGWNKPILYNVSHNPDVRQAYFNAPIDGATYQWYPLGLVAGHMKKGNSLPYVDSYDIPFDTLKGFDRPAKVVYEFDPADNLSGYLFPAMARTFRKSGFRWITQFAYDPIDMADANTEYQTHYLNLAYTPAKAVAMAIAAEVVKRVPAGTDFGKYPSDTVFGPFHLDAIGNKALMNAPDAFMYSGKTSAVPVDANALKRIVGVGSSPIVQYNGSGAYFLDRLDDNTWRFEILPDVTMIADPFAKPRPDRKLAMIDYNEHIVKLFLPGLENGFHARKIADALGAAENSEVVADSSEFAITPGVYLLAADTESLSKYPSDSIYGSGNLKIGEYVGPTIPKVTETTVHLPRQIAWRDDTLHIEAILTEGPDIAPVDSAFVYPREVSFWDEVNPIFKMERAPGTKKWMAELPPLKWYGAGSREYNIVVWRSGKPTTWPDGCDGTPLNWDYAPEILSYYSTSLVDRNTPIALLTAKDNLDGSALSVIPGIWEGVRYEYESSRPDRSDLLMLSTEKDSRAEMLTVGKYVGNLTDILDKLNLDNTAIALRTENAENVDSINVSVVNRHGFTYGITIPVSQSKISLASLRLQPTLLNPEPYPTFLSREFVPDSATAIPLSGVDDIDEIRVSVVNSHGRPIKLGVSGIWLVEE